MTALHHELSHHSSALSRSVLVQIPDGSTTAQPGSVLISWWDFFL